MSSQCVIRVDDVGPYFWHNCRQVLAGQRDALPAGGIDAGLLTCLLDADVTEATTQPPLLPHPIVAVLRCLKRSLGRQS